MKTSAHIGEIELISTEIAAGSKSVRFINGGRYFFANVTATPSEDGCTLYLSNHLNNGPRLTADQWKAAGLALFPDAKVILFERRGENGSYSDHRIEL